MICCFLVSSKSWFFKSFIFFFSISLISSIYLLIAIFLVIKFLFSFLRFLYLPWRSSILVNPSLVPALSFTTDSKKSVNSLCLSMSSSFRLYSFSFSFRLCTKTYSSVLLMSIAACSLSAFYYWFNFWAAFACKITVFRVTSAIISCYLSLYSYRYLSSSLALPMISSFCEVKLSSVSLSSLSF